MSYSSCLHFYHSNSCSHHDSFSFLLFFPLSTEADWGHHQGLKSRFRACTAMQRSQPCLQQLIWISPLLECPWVSFWLRQCFSTFSLQQNHLESLLNHRLLRTNSPIPHPHILIEYSRWIGMKKNYVSRKFPGGIFLICFWCGPLIFKPLLNFFTVLLLFYILFFLAERHAGS